VGLRRQPDPGRPAHRQLPGAADCFANADRDAERDRDSDLRANTHRDAHRNADIRADRDTDTDPRPDCFANADRDRDAHRDVHCNGDVFPDCFANINSHRHADDASDRHIHRDGHLDANRYANGHTDAHRDIDANRNANRDADDHADAHLDIDADCNANCDAHDHAYADPAAHLAADHLALKHPGARGAGFPGLEFLVCPPRHLHCYGIMSLSIFYARAREGQMQSSTRLASIDCFRGFAVLAMVLASYLFGTEALPAWLRHAPDGSLTVVDLGAPLFIIAIGLTFGGSLQRHWVRDGPLRALWHFLRRALLLFVIGLTIAFVQTRLGRNQEGILWGVLQAIAVAIVLTLPTLRLPPIPRAMVGLALLAVYQALLVRHWLPLVLAAPHGGLPGALGWASLLILGTACGDLFFRSPHRELALPAAGLLAVAGALALSPIIPISKPRVSASYILLGVGISVLLFWVFHLIVDRLKWRPSWLATPGKNPLLIYLLQYVLLGLLFVLPGIPRWYPQTPVWLIVVQATALLAAVIALARFLERRGWTLSL
jgi:predicted acyltransferase